MMWVDQSSVNHLPIEGLGCFQFGAVMSKVAVKFVSRFLCELECPFLWDKGPRVPLLGHVSTCLVFLRNYWSVFQSGCTIFCAHQQCGKPLPLLIGMQGHLLWF